MTPTYELAAFAADADADDVAEALRHNGAAVVHNVLDDDTVAELEKVVDDFVLEFRSGKGQAISKPGHEEVGAAEADDVNQEKIVKGRR